MYVVIYGVYILVSLLLISILYRTAWQDWLLRVVLITVLPGIGWLLPMFWPKWVTGRKQEDFEDYMAKQDNEHNVKRIGIYQRMERQQELDIIPIEEALLVNEHKTRRKVIIDVLKQDAIHYLEILQRAVSNEDKETSYYAVSAIMEAKRKLQLALQELAVKFETDSANLQTTRTYAEVLQAYMRSGFLDERTLLKNRYTYLAVLQQLIELDKESEWAYSEMVELEMTLQLYSDAERSARKYLAAFPNSENAYICMMKVYYGTKSFKRMQEVLDDLKKAPIKLSNHALTMVRFWSEGA
jgi:hypothetical protein